MKYELCIACDHCDPSNTNDRQQVFCEKNPPYVDPFNGCDEFENKAFDECFKNIGKSELTGNEIIKALMYCLDYKGNCENCPYRVNEKGVYCIRYFPQASLDLINRQQAEIERLEAENNRFADLGKMYSEIRSEAIKEFAERLKENKIDIDVSFGYGREVYTEAVAVIEIDNLVQEMVGDNNAE